jgi:hypothetical protein
MTDTTRPAAAAIPSHARAAIWDIRIYTAVDLRHAREAGRAEGAAAERRNWAGKLREMATAILPEVRFDDHGRSLQALASTDPNSPMQAQGRLLLDLAALLDTPAPATEEEPDGSHAN